MFGVHWARKDRSETHFSSHVFNHQGSVRVEDCLGSACSKRKSRCPPHLTTRRKGGWFRFARVFNRCCLPMFHWPLEEHRMRAWPLNHLKSCSAQLSQKCGQWAKAEHCLQCFSCWPPCNTHTPPPPNLLQPGFSPYSKKAAPWNLHADRVSMIVSMQIRPNLHLKIQGVTLSSSMDIFFPSHLMCL